MYKTDISIIVPVYQSEKFLKKCIESILAQSFKSFELLLINDGSTDNSEALCLNFKSTDDRVKYFYKENGGVSSARNFGLKRAVGKYIAFIDADDWIEPKYLEQLFNAIEQGSDMAVCGFTREFYSLATLKSKKEVCPKESFTFKKNYDSLYTSTLICNVFNKLFRTDIIKNCGLIFDEGIFIGEDVIFSHEYIKNINTRNIVFVENTFYHYVCGQQSLTKSVDIKRIDYTDELFRYMLGFHTQQGLNDRALKAISGIYLRACFINIELICFNRKADKKQKRLCIEKIFKSNSTNMALNILNGNVGKEFLIYKMILLTKNCFIIKCFALLRLKLKNMLRNI